MLLFQLIYLIGYLIPFINTILDDDILYDIKWQPELISGIGENELADSNVFTSKRKENYLCILPTPKTTILVENFKNFICIFIDFLDIFGNYSII
jgi:hypothetical protein